MTETANPFFMSRIFDYKYTYVHIYLGSSETVLVVHNSINKNLYLQFNL